MASSRNENWDTFAVSHSKACVLPKYLVGGAESVGQDSGLIVTEGHRGLPSLHIGGPVTWGIYILINIPQLKMRLYSNQG